MAKERKQVKRRSVKRRSPQAKALGLPLYRPRVLPDKRRKALNSLVQMEATERAAETLIRIMEGYGYRCQQ